MNWARGLFRLWLILSVLWIGGIVSMMALDGDFSVKTKVYDIEGTAKERYQVTAPATSTPEEVVAFAKLHPRDDCSQSNTGPWCQSPVKLEMPAKEFNKAPVYVGFGVPVVVLFAGAGLYWALAGFRRNSPAKSW
jgi:hypothetical protein